MVEGVIDRDVQTQANGFDMTLLKVEGFIQGALGTLGFDNSKRNTPLVAEIPFNVRGHIHLRKGCYLITLDPKMSIPKDEVWELYSRSSLVRMGCGIDAGVFDAGFIGRGQVLLTVKNHAGIDLYRGARIAQMVAHKIEGGDVSNGYFGTYQEKLVEDDNEPPGRHC